MPVKIRLQRKGKKKFAFYHIVIADSRAPRDGRFIENVGVYNPNTNPATIDINFDKALSWLQKGAQPTDTCRAILSYRGILYKNHLLNGVKKGALTLEQVEAKFEEWLNTKDSKINAKKDKLHHQFNSEMKKRMDDESKVRASKAEAIAKRNAKAAAVEAEVEVEETPEAVVETVPEVETTPEVVAEVEKSPEN
ncbi:MAG: 30S ribosomal protein S16 [Bacteroidetes bacterium GWA2_31_9]|nr:MAG: 30S ribosomal protein S16 [Bacteroidetes bacterium GWA2_31_9]